MSRVVHRPERRRPRLLFLSQFAHPGTYDKRFWRRINGRDNDTITFGSLLESMDVLTSLDYAGIRVPEGEPLPGELSSIDAVIVGGSFASVSDDHPWQRELSKWLLEWRRLKRPTLGICGGHQLINQALGGRVERSTVGPEVGSLPVMLTPAGAAHPLFAGIANEAPFFFGNFDRVVEVSPGGVVLATRPSLPAAAIDHGDQWVSVQFHPEATCDWMATCWAETDARRAAEYHAIPGCERLIANFISALGVDCVPPALAGRPAGPGG